MTDARAPRTPMGLCGPFVAALGVTGASISVFDEGGRQSTVCASDATAARIDEIQLELGEGPHWEALRSARPVLVPVLGATAHPSWPVFSAAARELGVSALFAFPMSMGAVTVGVVDLYSTDPGALSQQDIATAARLTDRVARHAVQEAVRSAREDAPDEIPAAPAMRREVHQATGMIAVQLDVAPTEAFFRLRAHAFASARAVQDVARDVVAGRLDFRDLD